MTASAALIVFFSALTHAGLNLFGKKVSPSGAFFWHTTFWSAVLTLPLLVWLADLLPRLDSQIWQLVIVTGLFQATYLRALAAAYRHGELSIVYPLARSSPLLILLTVALLLGRTEHVSGWLVLGLVLIVAGCIVLPMRAFRDFHLANYGNLATLFSLLAAVSTAGYSLVDDTAVMLMRDLLTGVALDVETALLFVMLQAWSALIWLSLGLFLQASERRLLLELACHWRSTMVGGALIIGTYGLVVWAMAYVEDVSYIVAFRQISIPMGVGLGWYFLGERMYAPKLVGVGAILAGLMLLVLG
ncbi:MAG: DMT family transporter [Marinobacter sp.]|uniref:DMT family transporter n=1 Tax=Marinobacter sp. TaxID=50741 RepID=UPI00299E9172|nr:DMT family transporter [Marinobacter sp.]MDX1755415.1 DMT family transporter [Marinobacter sp.]